MHRHHMTHHALRAITLVDHLLRAIQRSTVIPLSTTIPDIMEIMMTPAVLILCLERAAMQHQRMTA